MLSVFQSLQMMATRLLVVNSRGMPCLSRLRGVGMPGHGFLLLGLAQAFEQADAAAVGIEGIDVVDDDELVAMPVELGVHAERGGVALDPAAAWPSSAARTERLLARPPEPTRISRPKCPWAKAAQIRLQPVVGRQMQHLVGVPGLGRRAGSGRLRDVSGGRHGGSKAVRFDLDF